jgi:hypothetical protein
MKVDSKDETYLQCCTYSVIILVQYAEVVIEKSCPNNRAVAGWKPPRSQAQSCRLGGASAIMGDPRTKTCHEKMPTAPQAGIPLDQQAL